MRWRNARRSSNVEDRRGGRPRGGGFGGGRIGLGGLVIVLIIGALFGRNPLEMLGLLSQMDGGGVSTQAGPGIDDESRAFVESIVGETEDVWQAKMRGYQPPTLVLFSGAVASACGNASSAVGPFYCPLDQQIYLDLGFFRDMEARLGGSSGEFAQAYVIAHEVGHHIQNLSGTLGRVQQARQRGENVEGATGIAVRQELQADCYAGVWAHVAEQRHGWLEDGDLEQALKTASAIGDDRLQRRSQGTVVPDAFTHGTSEQRVRWFRTGFEHGDPARCDTFAAATL
jgi:uncharacterized protein